MRTKRLFLGGISAVSITAIVGWNASASAGEVIIDFSHTPGPDGLLGTKDDVPIQNNLGTGGELTGDEFVSVGIHFSTTGLQLNIGCGTGMGDPGNCLGADASVDDDFAGLLIGQFTLGGGPATVATLFLDVVNDGNGSFTTLFDSEGRVITTFLNDVSYDGPTPVARFETQLNFDGHFTVQYAGLGQCPWDLDGDGVVGVGDLLILVQNFGPCDGECPADFDGDGFVGVLDLLVLIANFGECPGTGCPWDVNGDGVVNRHDLVAVVHNLGLCDDPDNCPWDVNGDGIVNGRDVAAVATHFGLCP